MTELFNLSLSESQKKKPLRRYTNTREGNISARNYSVPRTFSRGIWKSVSVSTGLAVLHVVPEILYTGEYDFQA